MSDLPNAVVTRLLAKHGDGMRVSGDAIDKAVAAAEDYIARLAREAHALAVADKRKTVMETDITKARTLLGWEPHVPLEEGISRTIEYFRTVVTP